MRSIVAIVVCALLGLAGGARGAADSQSMRFDADLVATRASDSSARVDVYVQIPYQQVSFIKDGDVYTATYEIAVQVRTVGDSLVKEKTWIETLREPVYETTIGRTGKFAFHQKAITLAIGEYLATVTLTDNNARRSRAEARTLHVPDYAHATVAVSSLLLASGIADMAGKRSITPHVAKDVSALRQGVFVFFEAYARKRDTLDAVVTATTAGGREALRTKRMPIAVDAGTTRQFVKVQTELLSQGTYTLTLSLVPHAIDADAPADLALAVATMGRAIGVEWSTGIPQTEDDLERAVTQLRWIASATDMDIIRGAATLEAKREAYKKFWLDRDPTPGTPRNEALELYMSRIRYANEHYKGLGGEGYASDQGMVYVIFGEPSSIESHPFEYITYGIYRGPYVIWYYQRYNRSFVFIDQDGFGDFRLASAPPVERFRYGY